MAKDAKSIAARIVESRPLEEEESLLSWGEEEEEVDEEGLDVAVEEILAAVTASDPVALKEALKAFVEQC